MNVLNAIAFAAFGSLMELLPRVFPSWFPPTHSDQASCRALWLDLMGAVQMTLGLGFILRTQVLPALYRALVILPAAGRENLALPNPRGVGTR